jgi:hypothetical protein
MQTLAEESKWMSPLVDQIVLKIEGAIHKTNTEDSKER